MLSCQSQLINTPHQQLFEEQCWNESDTLHINVLEDGQYNIFVHFEKEYEYRNLYVKLFHIEDEPEGTIILSDPLIDVAGNWMLGQGNHQQLIYQFQPSLSLKKDQTISITQFMRAEQLCGIKAAGLLLVD